MEWHPESRHLEPTECRWRIQRNLSESIVDELHPTGPGSPSVWDPPAFGLAFRRLAMRALGGVAGNIGPHVLRHTATTLMLQQGLGPKVVADRLGHSTTRMTLDVYAHVAPEIETRAADAVAAAI